MDDVEEFNESDEDDFYEEKMNYQTARGGQRSYRR